MNNILIHVGVGVLVWWVESLVTAAGNLLSFFLVVCLLTPSTKWHIVIFFFTGNGRTCAAPGGAPPETPAFRLGTNLPPPTGTSSTT